jgi:hypothetical protein
VLSDEVIRQRKLIREGMGTVMRAPDKPAPGKKRKLGKFIIPHIIDNLL